MHTKKSLLAHIYNWTLASHDTTNPLILLEISIDDAIAQRKLSAIDRVLFCFILKSTPQTSDSLDNQAWGVISEKEKPRRLAVSKYLSEQWTAAKTS